MKNLHEIQSRVRSVVESLDPEEFIYDLLRAYGQPKSSVARLRNGSYNRGRRDGEILWKKQLFFAEAENGALRTLLDEAVDRDDVIRHSPRFVVATNYKELVARDLKTNDSLDVVLADLPNRYEFFLPWAGIERSQVFLENPADIKAAEKMALLYDEILNANPAVEGGSHDLNVFFARLLFCLFAEDTGIFKKDYFSSGLDRATSASGTDVDGYLDELFAFLDVPERNGDEPFYLRDFPYVNGGLFRERIAIPRFSQKARRILLECGSELNWSEINPDIFGSMIQAVVREDQRSGLGMHYTSVPNIMKVIGPLFLDELRSEFESAKKSAPKLKRLMGRLSKIKFFDPACGSGNFLIVTYKEIRKLEMEIIAALEDLKDQGELLLSQINLQQFYGIELDDFAHEVAILALWLAEHQMNLCFEERFGRVQAYLPLTEAGRINCGNAARLDWSEVCPLDDHAEAYVMGNPPYLGFSQQSSVQKDEKRAVFAATTSYKKLDYIAIWFVTAARYIRDRKASCAFVSTASIAQGEQVDILWPGILFEGIEIAFAYRPFRWSNNARGKAAVSIVIIGLRNEGREKKLLFSHGRCSQVENISPYLLSGPNLTVGRRAYSISRLPEMSLGNKAFDFGHLVLSTEERDQLVLDHPSARPLIRPLVGGNEILDGTRRWCLWIDDDALNLAQSIPPVADRIEKVRQDRYASSDKSTRALAERPHQFRDRKVACSRVIIVPETGSARRNYVPAAILPMGTIMSGNGYVLYDADLWAMGIIVSRMHFIWMNTVGGRMKDDPRYSATLCYNTFPFPMISRAKKDGLDAAVRKVIIAREWHSEKTLSALYDPERMPDKLRVAHAAVDLAVDQCYRSKPFSSDEERLEALFETYEAMPLTKEE